LDENICCYLPANAGFVFLIENMIFLTALVQINIKSRVGNGKLEAQQ